MKKTDLIYSVGRSSKSRVYTDGKKYFIRISDSYYELDESDMTHTYRG